MNVQKQAALPPAVHSCCNACIRAPVSVVCIVTSGMNYALSALFPLEVQALSRCTEQGHLLCKLICDNPMWGLARCQTAKLAVVFI